MKNPFTNPLEGRLGNTLELLKSLTPEELQQYVACYQWRRANETFSDRPKNMYRLRSYFTYRTSQFIYDAQKLLKDGERHEPTAN